MNLTRSVYEVLVQRLVNRRSCPKCGTIYNLISNPPKIMDYCDICDTKLTQRKDDNEETARLRFETYEKETAPLYETKDDEVPSLYVRDVKIYDDRLPDGFYQAHKETQKILENSHTFKLTNNKYEADYFLETEIDTAEILNYDSPVIIYRLILLDQRNGVIKEWKENIRRVRNDDRSWW